MNVTPDPVPSSGMEIPILREPGRWWLNIVRGLQLTEDLTAVAESLALHAHPSGRVSSPGRKKVCQDTGLEPEDVSKAFRALRDGELLDVDPQCDPRTGRTRYLLIVPSEKTGSPQGTDANEVLSEQERDLLLRPAEELVRVSSPAPGADDDIFSIVPAPSRREPVRKPSKRKGIRRRETVLYHYYDDQDVLLYVGITANMFTRTNSHETDSTWMDFAARSTIEHFPDRESALEAEKGAIRHHRPLFNVEHNEHPDREARLVDYLIDRDRRDLLAPAISRG